MRGHGFAILFVAMLVVCTYAAPASETARLTDELERALNVGKPASPKNARREMVKEGDFAQQFISQIRYALASGAPIEEMLRNVRRYHQSEQVAKLCDALLLAVHKERESREAQLVVEVEDACKRAGEAALKAEKTSDLDPVLVELSRLRDQPQRGYSEVGRRAAAKVESTIRFVTRWQDYLAQLAVGNPKVAREKLTSLADDTSFPIVPRSEILARIEPLPATQPPVPSNMNTPTVEAVMLRIRTLDDVADAVKELRPLRQSGTPVDFEAINELITISNDYEQVKSGLPLNFGMFNATAQYRRYPRLKAEMMRLVLPRHLGAPDRKPAAGETVDGYLNRLERETKEAGEWTLLVRVLETATQLTGRQMSLPGEIGAVKSFIAGENQYGAAQYTQAVLSYQLALREGGETVPVALIGARLKEIQTKHAKDYEEARRHPHGPPPQSGPAPSFPMHRRMTAPDRPPSEKPAREEQSGKPEAPAPWPAP